MKEGLWYLPEEEFDEWLDNEAKASRNLWRLEYPEEVEELTALGISSELVFKNTYLCDIDGEQFYYYPGSGKWKAKGSSTIYNSESAESFVAQIREYRKSGKTFKLDIESLLSLEWDKVYTVKELIPIKGGYSKYIVVVEDDYKCWSNHSFEKQIEKPGAQFFTAPCCALKTKKESCSILIVDSKTKQARKTSSKRKTKK